MRRLAISALLAAGLAAATAGVARADTELAGLERALPSGWPVIETASTPAIPHARPCSRGPEPQATEPDPAVVKKTAGKPKGDGALLNLELRYRLETRWTP